MSSQDEPKPEAPLAEPADAGERIYVMRCTRRDFTGTLCGVAFMDGIGRTTDLEKVRDLCRQHLATMEIW